jgi:hypothetical protein
VAIEAPFQILLKLTMMALGILPLPGTEKNIIKNRFDIEVDLSWLPIVSSGLSVIGIIIGALWTVDPIGRKTNNIIGKLTFIPIFYYRMLIWLLILLILDNFSVIAFVITAGLNLLVLLLVQGKLIIDPAKYTLLSFIFPVYKLPSNNNLTNEDMKILFWMVLIGNLMFLVFFTCIYCLYYFNVYNPWGSNQTNNLLIMEELFKNVSPLVIASFVAATLPIFITYLLPLKRYLCRINIF